MLKWLACGWMMVLVITIGGEVTTPTTTTTYERTALHDGPGHTYFPSDILNPGLPVNVVERNAVGTWVKVERVAQDGDILQQGWLQLGELNIPETLNFADLPVTHLPDADLTNVNSRSMRRLYEIPVLPEISDAMVDVFKRGQRMSRKPNAITKVGDSLSADPYYLTLMGVEERELGPFGFLEPTIDYYSESAVEESVAAKIGLSSLVLFDPFWADDDRCEPNENSLECEYRLKNPSVAFIMFGPNDVLSMSYEEYGENIRRAVEETLALGIIPALSTFSYHPDHEYWWQSVEFNLQLIEIAEEYEVPLINLWSASRPLPEYGLDRDFIHMKQSGFAYLKFDSGHETFYGTSLRNLLAIRTLHEIRLKLGLGN